MKLRLMTKMILITVGFSALMSFASTMLVTNRCMNRIEELETRVAELTVMVNEVIVENEAEEEIEKDDIEAEPVFYLSDYQRNVVECMVAGESIGEPYDGQLAVAQCVLNACLKDNLQPSEVRTKYKYSGWNTNPTDSVKKAVSAVFDEGYKVVDEKILYFYAPKYATSSWHESQHFVIEIGGHRFFEEWS